MTQGQGLENEHVPVLLNEVLEWLNPSQGKKYIDCTLGMSGMAQHILMRSAPDGQLLGIDQDLQAIGRGEQVLKASRDRVQLRHGNYRDLKELATETGFMQVDGVVFDLGVSTPQLMQADRGFSFMKDGPLDMRMDQSSGQTAAEFLERIPEKDLANVLFEYGEERYSRRIARAIVSGRREPILTTSRLSDIIRQAVPAPYRHGRIHCSTRTFQALRIAVNRELEGLAETLQDAVSLLKVGGRLCVIAFHSLEDRIVKQTFRTLSAKSDPVVSRLVKKPVIPTLDEQRGNPRSRSAKLRIVERLPERDEI